MSRLRWLLTGLITGIGLVGLPGFAQTNAPATTITPSPELKQELESSGDPPEAQKIEAESQQLQLQIQGQPTPAVELGIPPLNDPTLLKLEQGEAGPDPDPADAF